LMRFFFFSSRRRHTRCLSDWSSDVCSSDLGRNWVGDIGLRNLAGGVDAIDYGRPGFTMTGFTPNGEGGITQGATESIFSVSNAKIGRASCRERVEMAVGEGSLRVER